MKKSLFWSVLAGSLAANAWTFWKVVRPLRSLTTHASQLAQGDMRALEKPCGGIREIGELRLTMASMAQHVQRAQAEEFSYRHALTDGQEAERARIAHELHDDTVQALIAIAQSLELAGNWIETDPQRARTMMSMARTQAVESVNSVRRLIADLRPPELEELGIAAALDMLTRTGDGLEVTTRITGSARRIGQAQELTLFRIAQEAIRNAEKHGKPQHIALELAFHANTIDLIVRDDGIGFVPPSTLDGLAKDQHFGLIGMQERVQQLNGTLKVNSRPGHGTEIHVTLPLEDVAQPTENVRDPVCGAIIPPEHAYGSTLYNGERYFFCCPVCMGAFQRDAQAYISG